jgi:hypothetical protein
MKSRIVYTVAILTTLSFFLGFVIFFAFNPQGIEGINILNLASYNVTGINARIWVAIVAYCGTGVLNILFCFGLLTVKSRGKAELTGKILIFLCGLIWLTFGLLRYNPTAYVSNLFMIVRLGVVVAGSFSGLLILALEYSDITQDRFLKWYTLITAGIIFLLSLASLLIFNDDTWVRTNVSLIVYFAWFVVFGARNLFKKKVQQRGI